MKKSIFILIIALFSLNASAQSKHLTFKDIPIDGKISNFVEKMKNVGFSLVEIKGNFATMNGQFAEKNCEIIIVSSPETNTVWKVSAYFPKETTWSSMKSTYQSYKEQYQQKYGNPTDSFEFFSDPYFEGDGYELQAISNEKCSYFTYWESDLGIISLKISKFKQVCAQYEDKINVDLKNKENSVKIKKDI